MNKIININDFFNIVERTINIAWGDKWGTFSKAYPTNFDSDNLRMPLITYSLKTKQPSQMGSQREIKPRVRGEFRDPNNQNDLVTVYGQRFDCIVEFTIWGDNEASVSELTERFEDSMLAYTGIFKEMGLIEVIFVETTDEIPQLSTRISTVSRSVTYKVVIDRLIPVSNAVIEDIKVKLVDKDDNLIKDVKPFADKN